jgi:hypothetical protein
VLLNDGVIPEQWNETNVVLIPKVREPKSLKVLWITLYNVLYKIVSKVLT